MKNLFSFIMVGLAFTVLQVSTSQADPMHAPNQEVQGIGASTSTDAAPAEKKRDKDGIWKRQTHGAKQGRIKQGTKISAKEGDEKPAPAAPATNTAPVVAP